VTPPTVQFIPASGGPWADYADGIFRVDSWHPADPNASTQTVITASSAYDTPSQGFYSSPPRGKNYSTGGYPTWIVIWDLTSTAWTGAAQFDTDFGTTSPNLVIRWGNPSLTMVTGRDYIVIYQTQDPSFSASWPDYDGPTS